MRKKLLMIVIILMQFIIILTRYAYKDVLNQGDIKLINTEYLRKKYNIYFFLEQIYFDKI